MRMNVRTRAIPLVLVVGYADAVPRLRRYRRTSALGMFHHARLLARPVAVFFGRALVVRLLAFAEADLELRLAVLPIHLERHERVALAFDRPDEAVQLRFVEQELARADRIRNHVRRCG